MQSNRRDISPTTGAFGRGRLDSHGSEDPCSSSSSTVYEDHSMLCRVEAVADDPQSDGRTDDQSNDHTDGCTDV